MIISMDVEKPFDNIQHPVKIKTLNKLSIKGTYLKTIKAISHKPIANILLNNEKMKTLLQRSQTR